MDRTERFYRIKQLIDSHRIVSREAFLDDLEISLATLKRDLGYMRDRLKVPIIWDGGAGGYRYDTRNGKPPRIELPGLWFNAQEAHALLAIQFLLDSLQPGLLSKHVGPIKERIESLLEKGDHAADEVRKRIRMLAAQSRPVPTKHFEVTSHAVLTRTRLKILHHNRGRDETLEREVSPQRLVHYRDNWYLDAWCHLRDGLRCFAIESIHEATLLDATARNIPETTLDEELGSSYGIFTGKADKVAKLHFTPERARWVAGEIWHPKQKSNFDKDGYYILEIPYRDDRELVMDILKHGPEVEVVSPSMLREKVTELLEAAVRKGSEFVSRSGRR